MDVFLYGALRDDTLLEIVLGQPLANIRIKQAELTGYRVYATKSADHPTLTVSSGDTAKGRLATQLTDSQSARLAYYIGPSAGLTEVEVHTNGQLEICETYLPVDPSSSKSWQPSDWQRDDQELGYETAHEVMSYFGELDTETLHQQLPRIRARAASRLTASKAPAPTTIRSGMTSQDVTTEKLEHSHRGFYALDTLHLRHKKFDGTTSDLLRREVFKSSDATIVLPYDPVTDQILMVEQFRMGPTGRGDPVPWCLEPVAGLVDPGETPEETAHREAWEEAGVKFSALETVANGYSSPGASTGYFFLYIGLCDLSDQNSDQTGIQDEGEDIRSHIIGFDHAMELVDTDEINVLPTILCLNWLARHRSRLRGVA